VIFSENRFALFRIMPWRSERDEAASHGRPRCFTNSATLPQAGMRTGFTAAGASHAEIFLRPSRPPRCLGNAEDSVNQIHRYATARFDRRNGRSQTGCWASITSRTWV